MQNKKQRIATICSTLIKTPGKSYSLGYFKELFAASKPSISEDISIIKEAMENEGTGKIETVLGAHGGVRYVPHMNDAKKERFIKGLISKMADISRVLPGGYIYIADILSNPVYLDPMAQIMGEWFYKSHADVVVTVATKGIPIAMSVARMLGLPLAIAKKESKPADGSVFTINYMSGSSRRLQTMSISKRMIGEHTRAIVIDDFISGGGTLKAICDMLGEFNIHVAGLGAVIAGKYPQKKKIGDYKALLMLEELSDTRIEINPFA